MKNFNKLAIAIAVFGCGAAASSFAQSEFKTDWYLAPSVNVMNADSDLNSNRTASGVGLRFGAKVAPMLDIQFGPSYSRTSDSGTRYMQSTVGADFLYLLSNSKLRPFVLAGAGLEYDHLEKSTGNLSRETPYLNLGLGLQYSLTDRVALQADVRHSHGFLRGGNQFGLNSIDNNYLTVGVNYSFGK